MPKVVPWLWFEGQAEAAAEFYTSVFPRSNISDVARMPDGSVLTVAFSLDGTEYVGMNGGREKFSEAVSFQISCADQQEVDYYWTRLSEGGTEQMCGWLKDRFGLSWQVVPIRLPQLLTDPDPGRAGRAMSAMMQMQKIVVADLETAADSA